MHNNIFKALSDPNRRHILELLKKDDMTVTEIGKHFSISQASLSHHLDILKRADLITPERQGQFIIYSINTSATEEIITSIVKMLKK